MRRYIVAGAMVLCATVPFSASATSVSYQSTHISGNEWELTYDVSNNSLAVPITEFTIYFNPSSFSNIAVGPAQPSAWGNPIAVQSDPAFLPDLSGYGYFDTVASNAGITPGSSLTGFSAVVDFSGSGGPPPQIFQIINPSTFATLDQGSTAPQSGGGGTGVPEPSTVTLIALGLIGLALSRSRSVALQRRRTQA